MAQRPPSRRRGGRLIVGGFGGIILVGTLLLALPLAHEPDLADPPTLLDAFFTATSATTVTGLATRDVAATWSLFGELVILTMIQLGGLGLMTAASIVALVLSQRLGLHFQGLTGTEIGVGAEAGNLGPLVRAVAVFSLAVEGVAAVVLSAAFAFDGYGVGSSLYLGVFHAVSAFNNAGFSLFDGGLERFATDWVVSGTIATAFVAGGLGFPVVAELAQLPKPRYQFSLFTKLTLAASGLLLGVGALAVLTLEWSNPATLGPHGVADKVLISVFQSATTRTAGFNTVPIGELRSATLLLFVLLMVIGANSASTGGGIKTSTFAVAIWSTLAELRGDENVGLFRREVPMAQQRQATSLVIVALGLVGTATFGLAVTDDLPVRDLLFEAASAFGTVGLSTGITGELGAPGRLLVIVLMFGGRVGPMTLGAALLLRQGARRFRYPSEKLLIG